MNNKEKYYLVRETAVPEVLLKVIEAKRLLQSGKVTSVLDATKKVDISRSSFYKYKDDIFPFHENNRGKTINVMLQLEDRPGLLSEMLNRIARYGANILTIHQSIPIGGIASVTIGMEILPETKPVDEIITMLTALTGVSSLKILGREDKV
ncbi:MAG: ACT domain-containing protein [Lachnospiraceae bacterium]|nr:ACT domain-containing protein [Lachnospiraceae bacterium]